MFLGLGSLKSKGKMYREAVLPVSFFYMAVKEANVYQMVLLFNKMICKQTY